MSTEASTQTVAAPSSSTETTQEKSRPSPARQETIVADQILTSDQDAKHSQISRVFVIAIDHSSHSQYAFDWAVKNILRKETDLVVLINVRPIPSIPGPYTIGATYMDFSEMITTVEEQQPPTFAGFCFEIESAEPIAMRGDARDEIVRKVTEVNADALVIGSRGLGPFWDL
ncbi:7072_t:CDS:2 [Ambispora leptoticha]|uniref:7072_t:CDS:1 n=1 Tax=Ambispora leptoticha TaxID=144679 RepID=A0A9N9E9U5_9GLOM|nr:7072_t:CDS:2 [Ambispora leptoticha]